MPPKIKHAAFALGFAPPTEQEVEAAPGPFPWAPEPVRRMRAQELKACGDYDDAVLDQVDSMRIYCNRCGQNGKVWKDLPLPLDDLSWLACNSGPAKHSWSTPKASPSDPANSKQERTFINQKSTWCRLCLARRGRRTGRTWRCSRGGPGPSSRGPCSCCRGPASGSTPTLPGTPGASSYLRRLAVRGPFGEGFAEAASRRTSRGCCQPWQS